MLNPEFPPIGGGAGNANWYLLREFAERPDLEVDLITSSASRTYEEEKLAARITVHRLDVKKRRPHFWTMPEIFRWTRQAYRLSRRLLEQRSHDLCHAWFGWPSGVIGRLLPGRLPLLVALRGTDVPGYNERLRVLDRVLFRFVSIAVWRRADAITATSKDLRALAERTYARKPIRVIYNGVDISEFSRDAARSGRSILFVGRLIKRKGVIHLIHAMRRILDQGEPCALTIVGDGPEREPLESLCRGTEIAERVTFTGPVSHAEVAGHYRRADLLVLPSLEESLANVILEAMASALPIVTTDTGAAELLDGNGIVVPRADEERLGEAVLCYLRSRELLESHGRRSREIAEGLSWKETARGYLELYEQIRGPKRPEVTAHA